MHHLSMHPPPPARAGGVLRGGHPSPPGLQGWDPPASTIRGCLDTQRLRPSGGPRACAARTERRTADDGRVLHYVGGVCQGRRQGMGVCACCSVRGRLVGGFKSGCTSIDWRLGSGCGSPSALSVSLA